MNNINSFGGQYPGFPGSSCVPPTGGFPGGGFPGTPSIPTQSTKTYADVVKNADTQSYYGQKDGIVTQDELFQYGDQVGQQLDFANTWKNQYGGSMGGFIDHVIQKLQNQWTATAVMLDNFGSFANNSGNGTGISLDDVRTVAGRDGNQRDVSGYDIQSGPAFPPDNGYYMGIPIGMGSGIGLADDSNFQFGGGFGTGFGGQVPPFGFGGGFQQFA